MPGIMKSRLSSWGLNQMRIRGSIPPTRLEGALSGIVVVSPAGVGLAASCCAYVAIRFVA